MRKIQSLLVALLVLASVPCLYAQEKQANEAQEAQATAVPLKVQFLVTEYDGTKKIASMPYTVAAITSRPGRRDSIGTLRVGARIPAATNEKSGEETYIDVGTNIDYWVWPWTDNRYLMTGTVALSSLYAHESGDEPKASVAADSVSGGSPLLHETRADFSVGLHQGQPTEALSVTDPITGRVFKLEITLDVMK